MKPSCSQDSVASVPVGRALIFLHICVKMQSLLATHSHSHVKSSLERLPHCEIVKVYFILFFLLKEEIQTFQCQNPFSLTERYPVIELLMLSRSTVSQPVITKACLYIFHRFTFITGARWLHFIVHFPLIYAVCPRWSAGPVKHRWSSNGHIDHGSP